MHVVLIRAYSEQAATVALELAHGALHKGDSIIYDAHALIGILGQCPIGPASRNGVPSVLRPAGFTRHHSGACDTRTSENSRIYQTRRRACDMMILTSSETSGIYKTQEQGMRHEKTYFI